MKRTTPESFLAGLNAAQREAVSTTEGPVLVLAGAGTGKTRVITHRIAHLLARGVRPTNILALTFTNKAAREMRERVESLLSERPKGLTLSTFHSLGMRILRAEAKDIGYPRSFGIHDTADQVSLIRTILRDFQSATASGAARGILEEISRAKSAFLLPEDVLEAADDDHEYLVAQVYARYQETLRLTGCVDFDDLILLPVRHLEEDGEARQKYRQRFRYILVDEYQDTNGAQYRFLQALVSPERNLCVVGDDDQSIYGFRGADREKILGFERDYPGACVVRLEVNYRSTEPILRLANAVIAGSAQRHEKTLRSHAGAGPSVRRIELPDEAAEVNFLVREIDGLRGDPRTRNEAVAVLLRSSRQARPIEEKLRLRHIPYTLIGGQSYFDRKEIRDILAYWKAAANRRDDVSLLRIINVPRRGFGAGTLKKIAEIAKSRGIPVGEALPLVAAGEGALTPRARESCRQVDEMFGRARERLERGAFGEMARQLVEEASYQEALAELYSDPLVRQARGNAVEALVCSAEEWARANTGEDFAEFLAALTLEESGGRDRGRDRDVTKSGVTLMTLHSAKGLEFPHVYLVGIEEDILPHQRSVAEGDRAIDEERRLFYVGVTRARRHLALTGVRTRNLYGRVKLRLPSRFLTELEGRDLFSVEDEPGGEAPTSEDVEDMLARYREMTGES